jgi:hypothetical protein
MEGEIPTSAEAAVACPGCGYDLRARTGLRCPECGLEVEEGLYLPTVLPWVRPGGVWVGKLLRTWWALLRRPELVLEEMRRPVNERAGVWYSRWTTLPAAAMLAAFAHEFSPEKDTYLQMMPPDESDWDVLRFALRTLPEWSLGWQVAAVVFVLVVRVPGMLQCLTLAIPKERDDRGRVAVLLRYCATGMLPMASAGTALFIVYFEWIVRERGIVTGEIVRDFILWAVAIMGVGLLLMSVRGLVEAPFRLLRSAGADWHGIVRAACVCALLLLLTAATLVLLLIWVPGYLGLILR